MTDLDNLMKFVKGINVPYCEHAEGNITKIRLFGLKNKLNREGEICLFFSRAGTFRNILFGDFDYSTKGFIDEWDVSVKLKKEKQND